jgi:peptidoglycan/LPS O-acetylase OafA/YrhL
MFIVFALFNLFGLIGKPMLAVIPLFIAVIVISALLGELVARFYSEPLNQAIRSRVLPFSVSKIRLVDGLRPPD